MPNVTVNPVQSISVRVNQGQQQTVTGTTTFVGSGLATKVNEALAASAAAVTASGTALVAAETSLAATTGEIPGKFDGGTF
jgi:hypothetical protein